jgi:hypothetical protein
MNKGLDKRNIKVKLHEKLDSNPDYNGSVVKTKNKVFYNELICM